MFIINWWRSDHAWLALLVLCTLGAFIAATIVELVVFTIPAFVNSMDHSSYFAGILLFSLFGLAVSTAAGLVVGVFTSMVSIFGYYIVVWLRGAAIIRTLSSATGAFVGSAVTVAALVPHFLDVNVGTASGASGAVAFLGIICLDIVARSSRRPAGGV